MLFPVALLGSPSRGLPESAVYDRISAMNTAPTLIDHASVLRNRAGRLNPGTAAAYVYNPLDYAWEPHRQYLLRFGESPKRVLFLGMNPGPFGMAQTGVPFGEVPAVRDWMQIETPVGKPPAEHPKRPVQGFGCPKSEVSGRRFWGLMQERFGSAEAFFQDHFVTNYCPLVFMGETGRNITPDKLPAALRQELFQICDTHLLGVVRTLRPQFLVGIGAFAEKQMKRAAEALAEPENGLSPPSIPRVSRVLHPSPASPHANRGWAPQAVQQLQRAGIWEG